MINVIPTYFRENVCRTPIFLINSRLNSPLAVQSCAKFDRAKPLFKPPSTSAFNRATVTFSHCINTEAGVTQYCKRRRSREGGRDQRGGEGRGRAAGETRRNGTQSVQVGLSGPLSCNFGGESFDQIRGGFGMINVIVTWNFTQDF